MSENNHQTLLTENDDPNDEEEYGGTPPVLPPRQPLPLSVKICGIVTLFTIAVIVGSTGHAAYESVFSLVGEAQYVASANLIAGLDHNADVCTDPWSFFCGKYEESHYMSGSRISDLSIAEWKRALKAYESKKSGQSAAFFDACKIREADDAAACDTMYENTTTLRDLWRMGIAHSNIAMSRMANPDVKRAHERTVVIWAVNDTSGVDTYPLEISSENDPCDLTSLFDLVMCPDWATASECDNPRFYIAGDTALLCDSWSFVVSNKIALKTALKDAKDLCYAQAERLNTPLGCFLRTAEYYPDTNVPYLTEINSVTHIENSFDTVDVWFERAREAVIEIAAPLGPAIRQRLENVKLHSKWSSQNLPTPPPQISATLGFDSFAQLMGQHDAWKMETMMRETTQVYPRWEMNSWSINAYYSPSTNEIYVPDSMAVLIGAIEPQTVGTLMFILSHELGHSFDPSSTSLNSNLLTTETLRNKYNNAKKCILSDYNNANETIGEDFADFIGIKAIAKYTGEKMEIKNEIRVKERTYSPAQQTLAAFGGFWCESTDNNIAPGENRDPHSLPKDRVVQAVLKSTSTFGYGPCTTNQEICQFETV